MTLYEQMQADRRTSMKDGDKLKSSMLGVVLSEASIKTKSPDDDTVIKTIRATTKVLKDVQVMVKDKTDKIDQHSRLSREIQIIESYLPTIVSAEELTAFISSVIGDSKDVGTIMKQVRAKFGSRADMAQASAIVRAAVK